MQRPEGMEKVAFVLSGISTTGLLQSIELAVDMAGSGDLPAQVPDYMDTNVSTKVVKIIQSYTGIVDKFVWRK